MHVRIGSRCATVQGTETLYGAEVVKHQLFHSCLAVLYVMACLCYPNTNIIAARCTQGSVVWHYRGLQRAETRRLMARKES
jgi:hypothetical protein